MKRVTLEWFYREASIMGQSIVGRQMHEAERRQTRHRVKMASEQRTELTISVECK